MMNTLLKAKHWQLFLLIFVLPFVIYIGWLITFFTDFYDKINHAGSADFPIELFNGVMYMILLMLIPAFVQYAWFWSMAIGLQKKLPSGMTMRTGLFKAFFIIPIAYAALNLLFIVSFFGSIENIEDLENISNIGDTQVALLLVGFMFMMMMSLFIMFCSFYQFWFIAKTIKSAELQRDVKFSEFVGEFFLVWFYPIGVWILQPTINKLVAEDQPV